MQIMVRLGEPLWRAAGAMRLYLDFDEGDVTVADVLARLAATYPPFETAFRGDAFGRLMPYQVFVNARLVPAGGEALRPVVDGDKVYLFLARYRRQPGTVASGVLSPRYAARGAGAAGSAPGAHTWTDNALPGASSRSRPISARTTRPATPQTDAPNATGPCTAPEVSPTSISSTACTIA